jgi:hypothetical protein
MKNLNKQVGVYRRPNSTNNHLKLRTNPLIPIGEKFGRWTVIENDLYYAFKSQIQRACRVLCSCAANTEAVRTYSDLRSGKSPSCGCKSRERSIETVWTQLLDKLSRRGWDFHLTLPQLKAVAQLPCVYCGKEPSNIYRLKYKIDGVYKRGFVPEMEIRYSGLDRVDSLKGYTPGNVVPCCGDCNGMKSNHSIDEFFALLENIQVHKASPSSVLRLAATISDFPA